MPQAGGGSPGPALEECELEQSTPGTLIRGGEIGLQVANILGVGQGPGWATLPTAVIPALWAAPFQIL